MKKLMLLITAFIVSLFGILPVATQALEPANLIANGSFETETTGAPASWAKSTWGKSTTTFTYDTTGRTGTRATSVKVAARTSGDSKWMHTPVNVSSNTTYTFSDWYKSSVKTSVDVMVTNTSGAVTYVWLGDLAASSAWKQASYSYTTPANTKTLVFYHYIRSNGTLTTDDYSLTGGTVTPTPPSVSVSAPAANATVSGTVAVSANAQDAQGVSSVQFKLDGNNLGAADTAAPFTVTWDSKTAVNGQHALSAVATNTSGLAATAANVPVTVNNVATPTPPTVSMSAPIAGNVSGVINVSANAQDAQGVSSVQFKLDGNNLGAADTAAPFSVSFDTKTSSNGPHSLSAVATNLSGLTATASPVAVTINNVTVPADTNLVANPSLETASGTLPASWSDGSWGTNTRSLTYESTAHTGAKSVKATVSGYTNGDVKWVFSPVAVTGGKAYSFSNWYKSTAATEVDAMVTMTDGTTQWIWLASVPSSAGNWQQFKSQFVAPAGATSVSIFQAIAAVGYVQSDDYSLVEQTPTQTQFARGIVSLTFDDGWRNIYTNGLPLLNKHGLVSTQYLLSGTTTYPDYMTTAMMQSFKDQGSEIAAHTVDHLDLTTLSVPQIDTQLSQNQNSLRTWFGATAAQNFATPYGAYNPTVVTEIKKFYRSHRSTDVGFNNKSNFDIYNIKVQNITNTTTPAQVKAWVDDAIANKTWLVLVYHEVTPSAADPTYAVTPANLDAELGSIKASGVTVKTVQQALDEIVPQL